MHGTFREHALPQGSLLDRRIAESSAVFLKLYDVHLGPVGEAFLNALQASGVAEVAAPEKQSCDNVYISFNWAQGFVHKISYKSHEASLEAFTEARAHEAIHAIAWSRVPVLHASPYNKSAPVIPCPRDWLRLYERTEADAYAKTGWLMFLAAQHNPAYFETSKKSPVTAPEYGSLQGDTLTAIETAARMALQKKWGPDKRDGKIMNFAEYYHKLALCDYQTMLRCFRQWGVEKPIVVRLTDDHHNEMGRSFGPNPFARGTYEPAPIKHYERKKIALLNARLGITDEAALPCLDTALGRLGLSPQQFLALSKGGRGAFPAKAEKPLVLAMA